MNFKTILLTLILVGLVSVVSARVDVPITFTDLSDQSGSCKFSLEIPDSSPILSKSGISEVRIGYATVILAQGSAEYAAYSSLPKKHIFTYGLGSSYNGNNIPIQVDFEFQDGKQSVQTFYSKCDGNPSPPSPSPGGGSTPQGGQCSQDSDCVTGNRCVFNICRACHSDEVGNFPNCPSSGSPSQSCQTLYKNNKQVIDTYVLKYDTSGDGKFVKNEHDEIIKDWINKGDPNDNQASLLTDFYKKGCDLDDLSGGTPQGSSCTLSANPAKIAVGGTSNIQIQYSNLPSASQNYSLICGDSVRRGLNNCPGTTGSCQASCIYSSAGTYPVSASLSGVVCDPTAVTVGNITTPTNQTQTLKADFYWIPPNPVLGQSFQVIGNSSGSDAITKYSWEVFFNPDNPQKKDAKSINITVLNGTGLLNIKLTVKDEKSQSNSIQKAVLITDPSPDIDVDIPDKVLQGQEVALVATDFNDQLETEYFWEFGGQIVEGTVIKHRFDKGGEQVVSFRASNNYSTAISAFLVDVGGVENVKPLREVMNIGRGWNPIYFDSSDELPVHLLNSCGANIVLSLDEEGKLYPETEALQPGKSYLIRGEKQCSIRFTGGAYSSESTSLGSGWNLIGFSQDVEVSEFDGCSSVIIVGIEPLAGELNSESIGGELYLVEDVLIQKVGYFVRVGQECSIP